MILLSNAINFVSQRVLELVAVSFLVLLTRNYFTPGTSSVPGPFLAKLSNIWRFVDVARGRPDITLYRLHRKYGDYVRIGPNVVSVRNPDALKMIYGINKGFRKVSSWVYLRVKRLHIESNSDEFLSCAATACQRQTNPNLVHHSGRRFPRCDKTTSIICILYEHTDRI